MGRLRLYLLYVVAFALALMFAVDAQEGDFLRGDKIQGDKVQGDKVVHNHVTAETPTATCGQSIGGGMDVVAGEDPWMVHMRYYSSFYDDYVQCGGSLVSNRWVLTSQSCFRHLKANVAVIVKIGFVNIYQHQPKSVIFSITTSDIINHSEYNPSTLVNDLSLARLPQIVPFSTAIQPICLGTQSQIPFGGKAIATGWKSIKIGFTEILQNVEAVVLSQKRCGNPEETICAFADGDETCIGYGGGPLMVRQGEQTYIIGALSLCKKSVTHASYARVPAYLNWIKTHILFE